MKLMNLYEEIFSICKPRRRLLIWICIDILLFQILRMKMGASEQHAAFCPGFDSVWYVLDGAVLIDNETRVLAREFFCASGGASYALSTGDHSANWLVFASSSR